MTNRIFNIGIYNITRLNKIRKEDTETQKLLNSYPS